MHFTTTVKVALDGSAQPLPGVKVSLYDKDRLSRDDLLGTSVTDDDGEARFDYSSDDFQDFEDRLGGSLPELYAVVYGLNDEEVVSTRSAAGDNQAAKYLTVRVSRELAERHGLLSTAG